MGEYLKIHDMETLKKIRVGVFVMCAVLVLMAVALCIFKVIPLWAMLILVLFPFGVLLSALFWLCLFTIFGDMLQSKNPPSCENCLWGRARGVAGHCLGESFGAQFGNLCDKYARDSSN